MSRHPIVKWAQRVDKLYITVELPDASDVKLRLEPEGKFFFCATGGIDKAPYEVNLDLFDKVDVNESKASVGPRNICYLVKKAENKWWSRLIKQEGKPPVFLKVDWDKWVDEDEEEDKRADMDFGDFDFSGLNMGDGGGVGDEEDESDTENEAAEETKAPEKAVEDTKAPEKALEGTPESIADNADVKKD